MPIPRAQGIALVIMATLSMGGCSTTPASSGDLDRRTGCSSVVAERSVVRAQVVMDVLASDCRDQNGQPVVRALAVDRVAHAVWQSLELPVDAVHVSVSSAEASLDETPTIISREDLSERFGPGPSGVVWPVRDRADETIWLLLPVAYLAAGLTMLLLVRRLRRAGLVVVLLRR